MECCHCKRDYEGMRCECRALRSEVAVSDKRLGPVMLEVGVDDVGGVHTQRNDQDRIAADADLWRASVGFYRLTFRTPIDLDDLHVWTDNEYFRASIRRHVGFGGAFDDLHYEVLVVEGCEPRDAGFRVARVERSTHAPVGQHVYDVPSDYPDPQKVPSTLFKAGILVGRLRFVDPEDQPQRDEAKERIKMIAAKAVVRHPHAMRALSALVAAGLTENELATLAAEEKCDWREIYRLAKQSLERGRDEGRDRVGGSAERDRDTALRHLQSTYDRARDERDAAEAELRELKSLYDKLFVDNAELVKKVESYKATAEAFEAETEDARVRLADLLLHDEERQVADRVRRSGCRCGKGYEHCTVCEYEERYYRTVPPEGSASLSDSGPIIEDVVRLHASGEVSDRIVSDLRKFLKSGLRPQALRPLDEEELRPVGCHCKPAGLCDACVRVGFSTTNPRRRPPALRPESCHCVKMGLCNRCIAAGFRDVNPKVDRESPE